MTPKTATDAAQLKAQILERSEREQVRFMRLQFTDILGTIKNVEVPAQQFEQALDGEVMFDGSSIEGFVRIEESDMYLRPDLRTFAIFPWDNPSGDRRLPSTFLVLTNLRGGSGFPRQAQLGLRYAF